MQHDSFSRLLELLPFAPHAFVSVDAALGERAEKSLQGLHHEVRRWRDRSAAGLGDEDCERLARWLNRNFYRLDE